MVGVAGRSKGCKTCKQRRVACSLEQPSCKVCIKGKRECGGYARDRVFVLDPRMNEKPAKKVKKVPVEPAPSILDPLTATTESATSLVASVKTDRAYNSIWNISSPTTRALYREQIIGEFLWDFLPKRADAMASNWFSMVSSRPNITSALEASTLAISTSRLGRQNNDSALVHESHKFYIQGLWELQKALWDTNQMYQDETLAACLAMMMYECFECPDQTMNGWWNHVNGCARLFKLRGASTYTEEFPHRLFLSFRQIEIQQALVEKRASFQTSPKWMEAPWKGRIKTAPQYLLDLMAELSSVVAKGYGIFTNSQKSSSPGDSYLTILGVVGDCWRLDSKFREFWEKLETESLGPVFWPTKSTKLTNILGDSEKDNIFPIAYQFPNSRTAQTCMLFWTMSSILWSGMSFIYKLLALQSAMASATPGDSEGGSTPGSSADFLSELPQLEHRTDVVTLAKNVCQSLEYHLQDDLGAIGPMATIFPLKVAAEALSDNPDCRRELLWARAAMKRMSSNDLRLMNHLNSDLADHAYIPG